MKRLFSCFLFIVLSSQYCFAQSDLSEAELAEFKDRAKISVSHFQDYLTLLGSKKKNAETKAFYKEEALKLFKNSGKDVTMEVSTLKNNRESRSRLPLTLYFDNIISITSKQGKYADVKITFADTWRVSNFYKVGDNKYVATATIFQRFEGYDAEGKAKYVDTTKKTIEIIIEKVTDLYGERWIVLLGDISVAETSR
jgi:hypothetical protein